MRKQVLLTLDVSKWPDDAVNLIENRIYTMPWVEQAEGVEHAGQVPQGFVKASDMAVVKETAAIVRKQFAKSNAILAAAPEAPERFDPLAKLTEIQKSLGLYKEAK